MSELQIGLIVLGVVFILLVLGFNWWQDRRVRRKMQMHFPGSDQDPLLGGAPPRQAVASTATSIAASTAAGVVRREPGIGGLPDDTGELPAADADDPQEPDPGCEAVIDVRFGAPVRGADLRAALTGLRQAGHKSVRIFAETDAQRHRARLHDVESYSSVQLAVLLANRSGPLTAIEWSQVWSRAENLSERFEGAIEAPDQQAVLEHAAKLDDACAALDTQVGLTLMLSGPLPIQQVIIAAQNVGFVADGGQLAWLAAGQRQACFTLLRSDGAPIEMGAGPIDRLNLLLDVPCSPADAHAFSRMAEVGRELARLVSAELVDDHGKPLADGAERMIDERLLVLFQQLEQAGLTAGGERALRVFS